MPHRCSRGPRRAALTIAIVVAAGGLADATPAQAEPPAAVAARFFTALEARDPAALRALLAPEATNVLPYTASGDTAPAAMRRFEGRGQVMGYFTGALERIAEVRFTDSETVVGSDGVSVVVENRGDMVLADGRAYRNHYVWRLRVEDGRITAIREFFNPVTAALAFGRPLGPSE